jgi:pimeloyl-ACP methyl ester carboxylesterase
VRGGCDTGHSMAACIVRIGWPRIARIRGLFPPDRVRRCASALSQYADLTQYTYLHFARDLEQVRRALGYGPLNLSAGSYGTRAAQVFLRTYPASVRTVYFGSVVPIDEVTPLTMAKASQAAFENTFDACAADSACRTAFPNLRNEFGAILESLDSGSVRISVPGAPDASLSRGRVLEWLRAQLYRPSTGAAVPWIIHRAHSGDWSSTVEAILAQARSFDDLYGIGLFFSITCAEDMAFLSENEIRATSENTFLGDYRVRQQQEACEHWPKASLPAGYREPVHSAVPAMFVSGDMDAATPLAFTEHAATGFQNRVVIVARGQGHTEWNECLETQYRAFVEKGTADGIDPSACPPIPRPPFNTAAE